MFQSYILNTNQIRQVIINLVRNGIDAMSDGGEIILELIWTIKI